jgi:MFS family permease
MEATGMNNKPFTRDFSLVVMGQIVSIFGSAILRFALDLYVLDVTGRADIFALVIALSAIPGILFSPVGGAIADRFNRRNLMVILDFSNSARQY